MEKNFPKKKDFRTFKSEMTNPAPLSNVSRTEPSVKILI